jgi:hypothetical protein
MGQYYKPISLDKGQWVYSHSIREKLTTHDGREVECGIGLKLMEHSYIGNSMMNAVENLLAPNGAWYKTRIVWAGDYADDEPDGKNLWAMHDDEDENEKPVANIPFSELNIVKDEALRFVVNHDTKEYVDLHKVEDNDGWKIHPLSLLTCEGNGRGGGDFHGDDERIGMWARDHISMEYTAPEGYQEVDGTFIEE